MMTKSTSTHSSSFREFVWNVVIWFAALVAAVVVCAAIVFLTGCNGPAPSDSPTVVIQTIGPDGRPMAAPMFPGAPLPPGNYGIQTPGGLQPLVVGPPPWTPPPTPWVAPPPVAPGNLPSAMPSTGTLDAAGAYGRQGSTAVRHGAGWTIELIVLILAALVFTFTPGVWPKVAAGVVFAFAALCWGAATGLTNFALVVGLSALVAGIIPSYGFKAVVAIVVAVIFTFMPMMNFLTG